MEKSYWTSHERLTGNSGSMANEPDMSPTREVAMRPPEVFVRELMIDLEAGEVEEVSRPPPSG